MNNSAKAILTLVIVIGAIVAVTYYAKFAPEGATTATPADQLATTPAEITPSPGSDSSTPAPLPTPTPTPTPTPPAEKTFTMADIAAHSSKTDCYTTINGSVYNLTSFIPNHPGGDRIVVVCGKDGTAAFTAQHEGQRRPANELASLKIGTLAK